MSCEGLIWKTAHGRTSPCRKMSGLSMIFAAMKAGSNTRFIIRMPRTEVKISACFGQETRSRYPYSHLPPPCHTYLDRLEIRDNLVLWVIKTEASGRIADHHTLVAYDYINHIPYQFRRAFSYAFKDNALFLLAFSPESMNIEMYHAELSE